MEKNKKTKWIKISFLTIFLIIILLIAVLIFFYISKLNMLKYVYVPIEEIEKTTKVDEDLSTYKNMVLFGINNDEEFTGRSGCMIIVSLNKETNEVKLTSIYSNTYVEIPEHGFDQAKRAYEIGGPSLAMSTLNKNFDLNITEYATINFKTIRDVINALGGVEVTVSLAEANQIAGITKAGTYNLTGDQVHDYQKIIMSSTHEFATERMRTILKAGEKRLKEINLKDINETIDTLLPQIETNMSKLEITKLLTRVLDIKVIQSKGFPFEEKRNIEKIPEYTEYIIPTTLEKNVQELHKELFNQEDYETTETVKTISEKIVKNRGNK